MSSSSEFPNQLRGDRGDRSEHSRPETLNASVRSHAALRSTGTALHGASAEDPPSGDAGSEEGLLEGAREGDAAPESGRVRPLGGLYRLDECLGDVGACTHYRATQVRLGRPVLIQFLREELLEKPDLVQQFEAEVQKIAAVRHPQLSLVLDANSTSAGVPYVVFEGGTARTLREWLEDGPPARSALSLREGIELLGQIGSALAAAHEAGVVHGALTPSEVVICETLGGVVAKLRPFGVGGSLFSEVDHLGPWARPYVAPEQALWPEVAATPAVDQYRLGAIAFELLSGGVPFAAASGSFSAFPQMSASPSAQVRRFRRDTDPEIQLALCRALAKVPSKRFASVDAFVDELVRSSRQVSPLPVRGVSSENLKRLETYRKEREAVVVERARQRQAADLPENQ